MLTKQRDYRTRKKDANENTNTGFSSRKRVKEKHQNHYNRKPIDRPNKAKKNRPKTVRGKKYPKDRRVDSREIEQASILLSLTGKTLFIDNDNGSYIFIKKKDATYEDVINMYHATRTTIPSIVFNDSEHVIDKEKIEEIESFKPVQELTGNKYKVCGKIEERNKKIRNIELPPEIFVKVPVSCAKDYDISFIYGEEEIKKLIGKTRPSTQHEKDKINGHARFTSRILEDWVNEEIYDYSVIDRVLRKVYKGETFFGYEKHAIRRILADYLDRFTGTDCCTNKKRVSLVKDQLTPLVIEKIVATNPPEPIED